MKLPLLKDAKVFGKRIFLRADVDVPLSNSELRTQNSELVEDDTRLLAWMPTLKFLLENGAKVIVGGHLGRPSPKYQISEEDKKYSLEPVAKWVAKRFKIYDLRFMKLDGFDGWDIRQNIFLLENLRFYEGEEENYEKFSKKLASLADIYVNDAFAASHRSHASIVGVPKYLPHFAGFRLQEEIRILSSILENPKRPLVVVIGGAKIETKLPLVEKMHHFADYVLVGGKIAQSTRTLLKVQHEKLKDIKSALLVAELNQEETDITPKSIENFLQIISLAKTVVWNGPIGQISNLKSQISNKDSEYGTVKLTEGIVESKAYSVVGGGDTVGFLSKIGLINKFSFVSTGGGAMLEFLSGEKLPGLEALGA